MPVRFAVGMFVMLVGTCSAAGQMSFSGQEREVMTVITIPNEDSPPFGFSSTAPGEFAEAAGDSASNGPEFASVSAAQFSNIWSREISMYGSVDAYGSQNALGTGTSRLLADFSISETTAFTFDASFSLWWLENPLVFEVLLEDAAGTRFLEVSGISPDPGVFEFSLDRTVGVLEPGDYRFRFLIQAEGYGDARVFAGYNSVLQVPGPEGAALVVVVPLLMRRRRLTTN